MGCDEGIPTCLTSVSAGFLCEGYSCVPVAFDRCVQRFSEKTSAQWSTPGQENVDEGAETYTQHHEPSHTDFVNPPKTVSRKSALLHHNELEEYVNPPLFENNMENREQPEQADHIELPDPSFLRKPHSIFGSVFSEGQSIDRIGDSHDDFTDWLFEPDFLLPTPAVLYKSGDSKTRTVSLTTTASCVSNMIEQ